MATTKSRSSSSSASSKKRSAGASGGGRCWKGYEPVPGKKPYSKGSCRKK